MALGRSGRRCCGRGAGGDGAGADRAQPATGSSTTDRKICSTDSGALSRALSALRPLRIGKISGIWQRLPLSLPPRARARRRRFQCALTQTDLLGPAGRRCGCWPTSPVLFSGIVVGRFRFGATMALGRSGRRCCGRCAGGDGAGADRAQPATGSSTTDRKICSTDSGALSRALSALRPLRIGKISGIWQRLPLSLPPRARARRRRFQCALTQTDLLGPAGRRCGCWPTSPVLFSGIVVGRFRFGATMALGRSGRRCCGRGAGGDGAGADRAQPATGSSTTDRKICSTDSGALSRALSALRPLRIGKISGIWQRLPLSLPPRARARRRRFQCALTQTDLLGPAGRRCGCWPTSPVLFSGIVVGRFGSGRRWRSGDRGDDAAAAAPAAMVPAPIERSQLPGHRQQIGNSAAPTVVALSRARSALRSSGSERSAEFGSVNAVRCPHARARRRQFQRALTPTDLHRPAGRRCGCWPTSPFLFRGIVVGKFGGGRWRSGDRRRC